MQQEGMELGMNIPQVPGKNLEVLFITLGGLKESEVITSSRGDRV